MTVEHAGLPSRSRRFVVLDRDGTINVERNYLSDPADLEVLPGVVQGLARFRILGMGVIVVTNQSAIGRGYFDVRRLQEIHARLESLLRQGGVGVDSFYYCPHVPEDQCGCRKPAPGMVRQAASDLHFDPCRAFVIGDKGCDILLGKAVGATTFLVTTGYGRQTSKDPDVKPDYVVDDLVGAAEIIERIMAAER